ncbi:MAG: hypothetical protein P8Y70_03990, partial [Candidatus Lokiarchaeota archaeon]
LEGVTSHPEFVDRTKEENFEEEIVAGFDEDESIEFKRDPTELKFWQKPPYSTLLNIELAKDSDVAFYDLSSLVEKFFDKMLAENLINYKVSGTFKSKNSIRSMTIWLWPCIATCCIKTDLNNTLKRKKRS